MREHTSKLRKCSNKRVRATNRGASRPDGKMKRYLRHMMVMAAVLLIQQLWVVAVAQGQILETAVGRVPDPENAASVLGNSGTATTQPGRADEKGNPALRGERRPFYRLHKSDVLDVDFIFSPGAVRNAATRWSGSLLPRLTTTSSSDPTSIATGAWPQGLLGPKPLAGSESCPGAQDSARARY